MMRVLDTSQQIWEDSRHTEGCIRFRGNPLQYDLERCASRCLGKSSSCNPNTNQKYLAIGVEPSGANI